MAIKPILFNTEMVKAILNGTKTQTRRLIKPRFRNDEAGYNIVTNKATGEFCYCEYYDEDERSTRRMNLPYQPGDILWVRETWFKDAGRYMYHANYSDTEKFYMNGREIRMTWRPSIHMPREAARLFLKVNDVRVERLLEMDVDDAIAEGVPETLKEVSADLGHYRIWNTMQSIWDSTIKPADRPRYGWAANPWVWAIEFERIDKEAVPWPAT